MKRYLALCFVLLSGCTADQQARIGEALFAPTPGMDNDYSKHLNAQMQASQYQPFAQTPQKPATAFYKSQYVKGMARVCIYDNLGSPFILTIGSTELCPI